MQLMRAFLLVPVVSLLCLAGCPTQPSGNENGNGQSNENTNDNGNGDDSSISAGEQRNALIAQLTSCGARTVTALPRNQYIEVASTDIDFTASPPDSPLAKVLYPQALCGNGFGPSQSVPGSGKQLYEVGPNGEVLAVCTLTEAFGARSAVCLPFDELQFVIEDGCLRLDTPYETANFDIEDFVRDQAADSPCGPGEMPLSRKGVLGVVEPGEPYICIRFEFERHCRDCGFRDGAWFETIESRFSAVARGSLDGVSAETYARLCNSPESTVNIRSGDRVTITQSYTVTYRVSPSPADLGYSVSNPPQFGVPSNP